MINRKRFLRLCAAALSLGLVTEAAQAQEFTFRLHHFLPSQATLWTHVLDPWAAEVEEKSGGRIAIQKFPAMQLGGTPPELIDQAIDGTADIVLTIAGYTPGRFPRTEVFELPFMMENSNAEATSRAYWKLAQETMQEDFSQFHLLGTWVHGPGLIHSKSPIEEVADLNGVKLRAPTRTTNMLFSSLGATPIGMPVPAVPEALSQGVIDATVIPWEVTASLRIAELVDNHTEFGDESLYTTAFLFAMNKDAYDKLPDDLKKVIDDASGLEFSARSGRAMQEQDAPARIIAEDRGNNIIELTPEQVASWKEASQPTIDAWVAEMDGKGLDGTGLLARARELISENQ
ncbi:TRAP transporter substrate-binding protein [Oceaniglobus roseus]|uniref:TRAP transporter substrate-binding protein n=1 Tax=Oceaniglobus roseus TaxID=1737570 RepID=UPI000C7EA5B3|nr:TRAP transporter substrate-binding protein [Kandeliimicrobium roseum]